MTPQEQSYASFANRFDFEYYAQPDNGTKSVIFSYVPKGMYNEPREDWQQPAKFEAESLEKAFNYAFSLEGLIKVPYEQRREVFGKIQQFQIDAWNKVAQPTKFFSLQDNCWKNLADVLEAEAAENERKRLYYANL